MPQAFDRATFALTAAYLRRGFQGETNGYHLFVRDGTRFQFGGDG